MRGFFKCCIVLLFLSNVVQAQNWLWSKSQNITSAAYLKGNIRLGNSGNLVSYLTDNSSTYLVLTDASGGVIWNRNYPGLIIKDVIVDSYDNIFFAGSFSGQITIADRTFTSQGSSDAIIGMLDKNAALIKANAFGAATEESVNSIALNGLYIYATGHFTDSQVINSVYLEGDGTHANTFIMKLDLDLTALTGVESSSQGSSGIKVAVDKFNSVYVLGNSNYTISIGTNEVYITENGQYVTKLTDNLDVTWLQAIIVHGSNGYFKPYIFFDQDANFTLGRVTGGGGGTDHAISVEKYDPLGMLVWKTGVKVNVDNFLDMDNLCNIYVAGGYTEFDGSYALSVAKVSPAGVPSLMIYSADVEHRVKGLAVKGNNDLYINYSCVDGALAPGMECEMNGIYMARYTAGPTNIRDKGSVVNSLRVRPNPNSGTVIVQCNSSKKQNCLLLVKNTLGEIIYLDPMRDVEGNYSTSIDLSAQPKGVYFVEMRSGNVSSVEKIVFQ